MEYDHPIQHARVMCRVGHTFREPIDDDVQTDDNWLIVDSDVEVDSKAKDLEVGYLSLGVEEEDY